MALDAGRLRRWFAIAIACLLVVVGGYYLRGYIARYAIQKTINKKAEKLGLNITQSTNDFTISKSEGGRTIFTVRASKAVQVKSGQAELHEVNIVVYGRDNNRFDQIYGSDFEYNPSTGEVSAKGEVHIDLQGVAEGEQRPDQAPPKELKNPIHLQTSGLTFNRNTGIARTNERIEFRIPQATGSAVGATYDSRAQRLVLNSQIELNSTGESPSALRAAHGVITNEPRQIDFTDAHISREQNDITAKQLCVNLRPDNSIEHVYATGDVTAQMKGKTNATVVAPRGDVYLSQENRIQSAALSGGVKIDATGDQPMHGTAGRVLLDFKQNQLQTVHALDNVSLTQEPGRDRPQGQTMVLTSSGIDFNVAGQHRADTKGPAQIVLTQAGTNDNATTKTVATADQFIARFDRKGRLANLMGSPNAKVVSASPGNPDKTTSSNVLTLTMNPAGGLGQIVQEGGFHYIEAASKQGQTNTEAFANKAVYDPQTELFVLTGSPRISDSGVTTTASQMRINRKTGDAVAEGSVKTTYSQLKALPTGALFAASDPIHVTAASMTARRSEEIARYTGGARLWQGANIVEAPTIEFNRAVRTVNAQGNPSNRVSTVFVEQGQNGKQTPVNVTGLRLTYSDQQRQARFEGGVVMRSAEGTVTADHVTVYLRPRTAGSNSAKETASELEKVVAEGRVVIQQEGRRGTGNRLTYLAQNGSFTLTGGSPSIFDAEHGQVTGDSLTFFSRDDRVLVEGGKTAQSITKAKVIK